MIGDTCSMIGVVMGDGLAIHSDDFKDLTFKFQVHVAIRRSVHEAPELALFRCDLDSWANCPIHGKDFLGCLRFSPTSLRRDFNTVPEFGRIRIMLHGPAAQNDHTLTELPYLGGITFHSLDNDGS